MLRGESAPEHSDSHARVAPARLEPPTIDVKAKVGEEKESRRTSRVSSAPLRRKSAGRFEGLPELQAVRPKRLSGKTPSSGRRASRLHLVA
jgi:hypothetical protein